MKILKENKSFGIFPMQVTCKRVEDKYGLAYGKENDFCGSELEINADDIKAHEWDKYPNLQGIDYGVVCPVCKQFIAIDKEVLPLCVMEQAEKVRLH